MVYHYVVTRVVRGVWDKINAGNASAAGRMAAPDVRFTVVGDTVIGGSWTGPEALQDWLTSFAARFSKVRIQVDDVAVAGWPWRTRIAVRLTVDGELVGGGRYHNYATQWMTLRWGRMTDDWVLEDTKAVDAALGAPTARRAQSPTGSLSSSP
ncbi:nuclear transport factor 2 family protein [Catenulispora yoronensis]|uniref:Nuclear transport factor 2 family protein n=1 Tax=Catenulispora yoronensis TaxID=450799 RepID=A0ABN2UCX3_9ACTN